MLCRLSTVGHTEGSVFIDDEHRFRHSSVGRLSARPRVCYRTRTAISSGLRARRQMERLANPIVPTYELHCIGRNLVADPLQLCTASLCRRSKTDSPRQRPMLHMEDLPSTVATRASVSRVAERPRRSSAPTRVVGRRRRSAKVRVRRAHVPTAEMCYLAFSSNVPGPAALREWRPKTRIRRRHRLRDRLSLRLQPWIQTGGSTRTALQDQWEMVVRTACLQK
jgi:hypothetical protein